MRIITKTASITGLLLLGLSLTPAVFAAGASGAAAGSAATGTTSTGTTSGSQPGAVATPPTNALPQPAPPTPATGQNGALDSPRTRDINRVNPPPSHDLGTRSSTPPPRNDCYAVDGQTTSAVGCPPVP